MSNLTSTQKGSSFEKEIFNYLSNLIDKNEFPFKKENCKLYRQKGYYSKDRLKNIIFDISIEIYFPHQDKYSVLFLIECKNYNHKVPVDDIEEFYQKVEQISGGNTKAIVVSSNAFQEGAFNFSQSKGIGLWRYRDKNSLEYILPRSPSTLVSSEFSTLHKHNIHFNLTSEVPKENFFDCNLFFDYEYTPSLFLFFSLLIQKNLPRNIKKKLEEITNPKPKNIVPYISNTKMEEITSSILKEIEYQQGKVDLNQIISYLEQHSNFKIFYNVNLHQNILGKIDLVNSKIYIDNTQCKTYVRTRFTIAHELGHYFLKHSNYMFQEAFYDNEDNLEQPIDIGIEEIQRMEWQANQFAAYLLLPQKEFLKEVYFHAKKLNLYNRGFGLIYLDNQKCNRETFIKLSSPLMQKYKVSRSVIKIRLKNLNLLTEESN